MRTLTHEERTRLRSVYPYRNALTLTHNKDGRQNIMVVIYKAARMAVNGGTPTNLNRQIPGGLRVRDVLQRAGLWGGPAE